MKLPKGVPVHENLNTAYTDFDQLLQELIRNQFSGYVALTSWMYRGIILIDSGNVVNVVEELEGAPRTGLGTLERVQSRAKDKDGMISVHRLERDLVALIDSSTHGSPRYQKLSTDLTDLDRLILGLQKEKLTGHVEVEMQDQSSGMIFLKNGESIAAFYSINGTTMMGGSAQEKMEQASRLGAVFNVYRSDPATSQESDSVKPELIEAWQKMLTLVQDAVDKETAPGNFEIVFKQGCLDHIDAFRFLDPFAGRFSFKNGRIQWNGSATDAQFNGALTAALISSTSYLEDRERIALHRIMNRAMATHRALLDICGLVPTLSQLFGSTPSRRIE